MEFWDGSGISWTICKQSAPHSRQITTSTSHHTQFLHDGRSFCCPTNNIKALKAICYLYFVVRKTSFTFIIKLSNQNWNQAYFIRITTSGTAQSASASNSLYNTGCLGLIRTDCTYVAWQQFCSMLISINEVTQARSVWPYSSIKNYSVRNQPARSTQPGHPSVDRQ